jgi:hypothetical protein
VEPIATVKHLIHAVLITITNNQAEIQHLRQENKDLKQQSSQKVKTNQETLA